MSAKYTYELTGIDPETGVRSYCVYNPSFVAIAHECSWRVARKIADLYNADVERRSTKLRTFEWVQNFNAAHARGAVSLQEEA